MWAHRERCRAYPVWTLSMRALCNGRNDLQSPLQIYRGQKRLIFEILIPISNYLPQGFNFYRGELEIFTPLITVIALV